jgi:transcriptional regulator with XRE-family HTH domain
MPNDALRTALARRSLTPQQLAEAIGVDAKTVNRWITDDSRLPHPRHRWAAAAALEVPEDMIWPRAVRAHIKTGADRELVTCYPCRSAIPGKLWRDLIMGARRELTFAGYTSYFVWIEVPGLDIMLRRKAKDGANIRFLLGDPDSPATAERDRIEASPLTLRARIAMTLQQLGRMDMPNLIRVRHTDRHMGMSVWLFDDDMLVSTHIADRLGHDSPTLHLQRRQDDGLFDRYVQHVEHLWNAAGPHLAE